MATLYMTVGIPGSGKSTFCRDLLRHAYHVSADMIRTELFGSLRSAHDVSSGQRTLNNKETFDLYKFRLDSFIGTGVDAIADSTNLKSKYRDPVYEIASRYDAELHVLLFDNIELAVQRNQQREQVDPEALVPDEVMFDFIQNFVYAKQVITTNSDTRAWDKLTIITH